MAFGKVVFILTWLGRSTSPLPADDLVVVRAQVAVKIHLVVGQIQNDVFAYNKGFKRTTPGYA